MLGMAFNAFTEIAALGLFLAKRTVTMTVLLYAGAALNFGANLLLVPHWGIAGSGMANIISDLAVLIAAFYCGRKLITPPPFVVPLVKFALCAVAAWAAAWQVDLGWHLLNLVVRSVVVLGVFGALAMACDRSAREVMQMGWRRVRSRVGLATPAL
jgi:O-antigen/teichoic acid export membrane protein